MKTISISFAWLVFACSQSFADEQRPNVLFIAIDDLRNDLGSLGVAHAKTPQLDAFAKTARVFSQHYVQVPTCGASRCALMRGRYQIDPDETRNHAETQPEIVRELLARLKDLPDPSQQSGKLKAR